MKAGKWISKLIVGDEWNFQTRPPTTEEKWDRDALDLWYIEQMAALDEYAENHKAKMDRRYRRFEHTMSAWIALCMCHNMLSMGASLHMGRSAIAPAICLVSNAILFTWYANRLNHEKA